MVVSCDSSINLDFWKENIWSSISLLVSRIMYAITRWIISEATNPTLLQVLLHNPIDTEEKDNILEKVFTEATIVASLKIDPFKASPINISTTVSTFYNHISTSASAIDKGCGANVPISLLISTSPFPPSFYNFDVKGIRKKKCWGKREIPTLYCLVRQKLI